MDRRIKYTKKIIKDTLMELLNTKDLNKITVSEICKIADINRATFYRYYLDVYDLVDKIKEEFTQEIVNVLNTLDNEYSIAGFVEKILNVFLDNQELVKILFNVQNNLYFFNEILELCYNKCQNKWANDLETLSQNDIEYATVFIFNGALGVINYWIQDDFKQDVTEVAKIIETLSYFGIKKFIYKK